MSVELDEVTRFLAEHEPFSHLPAEELAKLPAQMGITYVRRGEAVVSPGQVNDTLYIIRSGAVDIVGGDGLLLDRREAGLNFGYSTLVGEPESAYLMVAVEDSVLLMLPGSVFTALLAEHPDLERFFQTASRRVRAAAEELRDTPASDVLRTPLAQIVAGHTAATCDPGVSIAEAARTMDERGVSCLVLVDASGDLGVITDRDLRSRVVARGVDASQPVRSVMTQPVRTVAADALVFEAMLAMSELGVHHLPVLGAGGIAGVVSSADIMRLLQADPIFLAADVERSSAEELAGAYVRAADVAVRFFERGASAAETQRLLTMVADAVARRLFQLGVERFGPPPAPVALIAAGSQARFEMGPASDQDNAFVLADSFDEAAHGAYFAELAEFICSGLAGADQALCPGEMMASNPQWRMTEAQWDRTFHGWVTAPEPDALLHAQVFFDVRPVAGWGEGWEEMVQRVHHAALLSAKGSRRLHTHLAALATFREPPIGFFRGLVVERSGDYARTLDIKRGGLAAVVQLARLYAITAGVGEVNTVERLRGAAGRSISEKGAQELLDAYEYLSDLAVRHQAAQLRAGAAPDYHVDPKELRERDRAALRDAFGVIKGTQNALATQYPTRAV